MTLRLLIAAALILTNLIEREGLATSQTSISLKQDCNAQPGVHFQTFGPETITKDDNIVIPISLATARDDEAQIRHYLDYAYGLHQALGKGNGEPIAILMGTYLYRHNAKAFSENNKLKRTGEAIATRIKSIVASFSKKKRTIFKFFEWEQLLTDNYKKEVSALQVERDLVKTGRELAIHAYQAR